MAGNLNIGNERQHQPKGIAFALKDYLELVNDTGRIIRDDKRGAISWPCGHTTRTHKLL
jgi:hypothetical protein